MLIDLKNVSFGYDDKKILDGVSFTVSEGERIGLIGPNGEGKTTLMRVMTGDLAADEGAVSRKSGLKTGYLAQTGGYESENTVYEEMRSVFSDIFRAIDGLREAQRALAETEYAARRTKTWRPNANGWKSASPQPTDTTPT